MIKPVNPLLLYMSSLPPFILNYYSIFTTN